MATQRLYSIGGHQIKISYYGEGYELDALLRSFSSFVLQESEERNLMFHLEVSKTLSEVPEEQRHLIRDIDTGNGMTRVDKLNDGGYQFLIRNVYGEPCALLITSPKFDKCRCALRGNAATRQFAINNSLMLVYAFSGIQRDTLLIHASVVRHNGLAYAFTAKSGTGKSTQVANWMKAIEGCDIVNDDNPIVRMIDGKPVLFGSPWSGKTPCYRNINVPLGAIVLIERAPQNEVTPMQPIKAFSTILTACSSMKWDVELYQQMCGTISRLVEATKVVTLHCLPDEASAIVCKNYLES